MSVKEISEHIYMIDSLALGIEKFVAVYLVVGEEKNVLIDTSYASSFHVVTDCLREVGLKPADIDYVVPTHLHLDHSGSTSKFVSISSNIMVYCHPKAVKHLVDPSKLKTSVREIYGEYATLFGEVEPIPEKNIKSVEDGEELDLGDITLRFIHTTGHAPHHISVYVEEEGALITGDALSIEHPDYPSRFPTTPPPSYNHIEAINSLKKLSKLKPKIILKPHFGEKIPTSNYFEEEIRILEEWKNNVESSINMEPEAAFEEILRKYSEKMNIKLEEIPYHFLITLKLSFLGMRKYLSRQEL
ncbi:MAG: MBL fold metallo-hydrolase [Nitrososphaerota archaeon]|nr:MBL fold metallo-hydrolase [Candidatus Geocrenenecus dongiae]